MMNAFQAHKSAALGEMWPADMYETRAIAEAAFSTAYAARANHAISVRTSRWDDANIERSLTSARRYAQPNTLPVWNAGDEFWAELPLHVVDISTRRCIHCIEAAIWDTYEEYVAHFWANEFEGDPHHGPDEREEWELASALCNRTI